MSIEKAQQDVEYFMRVAGQDAPNRPAAPAPEVRQLRERIMAEEFNELIEAMDRSDLPEIADGVVDLIYVAIGTALAYGIDLRPIWLAVHAANMAKFVSCGCEHASLCQACHGTGLVPLKDAGGKVIKPPGWVAADVEELIRAQERAW